MKATVKWIVPQKRGVIEELKRAARTLKLQVPPLFSLLELNIAKGVLEELDDTTWSDLENTTSWHTKTREVALEAIGKLGHNALDLIEKFQEGNPVQAPIVLELPDKRTYLIVGTARLIMCRMLNERPKVLKIRIQ